MKIMKRVVLITGASSGIGEATAIELYRSDFIVYAAARRLDRMKFLADLGIHVLPIDVTDEDSMKACVNTVLATEERIDILINNAGYGSYGAVEDVPIDEARRQLDVNLFGLARMIQLVLPAMRRQHFGKIVNISSMAGKVHTPFGAWYHATKFAVEGFSDALRLEVSPFGIDVIIIEPGGINTQWGIIAADNLSKTSSKGVYAESALRVAKTLHDAYAGRKYSDVNVISKIIHKAVTARRPKTRYAAGYMAKFSIFARKILSDRLFDRIIKKAMNM
jgi:NAD(P)-dependent dehydrogenase (short-subunit alcohol dehydrogenase family)